MERDALLLLLGAAVALNLGLFFLVWLLRERPWEIPVDAGPGTPDGPPTRSEE